MRLLVLALLLACTPHATSRIAYEQFREHQHPRRQCDEARAITSPSTAFVLAERCTLHGITLPAGTGVTTWANADELHVFPRAPLRFGDLVCRGRHEVSIVRGRLSACELARPTTIGGIHAAASKIRLRADGRVAAARLDRAQVIGDLPLAAGSWVELHDGVTLSSGELGRDHRIGPWLVPRGSTVVLDERGHLEAIEFIRPFRLRVGTWSGDARHVRLAAKGFVQLVSVDAPAGSVDLIFAADGTLLHRVEQPPLIAN